MAKVPKTMRGSGGIVAAAFSDGRFFSRRFRFRWRPSTTSASGCSACIQGRNVNGSQSTKQLLRPWS